MPRGPAPIPTNIKLLNGNPGKRPINHDEPELPPLSDLKPPSFLFPIAKKEWKRLLPILARSGVITDLDVAALATYCNAYHTYVDASVQIKKHGGIVEAPNGYLQNNPYMKIQRDAAADMNRWGAELGLTPAARTRVKAAPGDEGDALDRLLDSKEEAS